MGRIDRGLHIHFDNEFNCIGKNWNLPLNMKPNVPFLLVSKNHVSLIKSTAYHLQGAYYGM